MLNPGYITLDAILERVKLKFGFDVDRYESAERIWDVINNLGIVYSFEIVPLKNVYFNDWRIQIPVNFLDFGFEGGMRDSHSGKMLTRSSDVFQIINQQPQQFDNLTTNFQGPTVNMQYATTPFTVLESTGMLVSNINLNFSDSQLTYDIRNGYFYMGYKSGYVDMIYKAFPVDENGMPKVPDDSKYIRAVVDYIGYMIAFKLKLINQISKDDLDRIERDYFHSAGAAKTKALTPDLAMMEQIRRFSQRLIPLYSQFSSGFRHMGDQEALKNI